VIVLDTNVLSEPLKPVPDPAVLAWLDRQVRRDLFLTTISVAELLAGVAMLPEGKRRSDLQEAYTVDVFAQFADRILAFDRAAAEALPGITQRARAAGRPVSFADSLIGAIAVARGFKVATRDASPFEAMGIEVINPWRS
jgi:hypothetical protein